MGFLGGLWDATVGGAIDAVKKGLTPTPPEKYDVDSERAKAAATVGGPRHDYDIGAAQATEGYDSQFQQSRNRQTGLADLLNGAAQGQGPSGAGMAAQAQRDQGLSQAAALQAGNRGRNAAAGMRMAMNGAAGANQQASQNEAIGRVNEMAGARGQLAGVLGNMAGNDLGLMGQRTQLNQFNAQQQQDAAIRNQAAQLGISEDEMRGRLTQEGYLVQTLNPGAPGPLTGILQAGAAAGGRALAAADGLVVDRVPMAADGMVSVGPGQRLIDPRAYGNWGTSLADAIMMGASGYFDQRDKSKKADEDKAQKAKMEHQAAEDRAESKRRWDAMYADMQASDRRPYQNQMAVYQAQAPESQPGPQSPYGSLATQTGYEGQLPPAPPAYAKGGFVDKPTLAIIGEAGPEAVVPLSKPSAAGDYVRQVQKKRGW